MMEDEEEIHIESRDYWFKIVEFLQQNWAVIDQTDKGVVVWFIGDTSGVFDEMSFPSKAAATEGLQKNGYRRYADDPEAQKFIAFPQRPFHRRPHPNGRIYSGGRFWK